jgi:hypothetical protein
LVFLLIWFTADVVAAALPTQWLLLILGVPLLAEGVLICWRTRPWRNDVPWLGAVLVGVVALVSGFRFVLEWLDRGWSGIQ